MGRPPSVDINRRRSRQPRGGPATQQLPGMQLGARIRVAGAVRMPPTVQLAMHACAHPRVVSVLPGISPSPAPAAAAPSLTCLVCYTRPPPPGFSTAHKLLARVYIRLNVEKVQPHRQGLGERRAGQRRTTNGSWGRQGRVGRHLPAPACRRAGRAPPHQPRPPTCGCLLAYSPLLGRCLASCCARTVQKAASSRAKKEATTMAPVA